MSEISDLSTPDQRSKIYRQHAEIIGGVAMAWNDVQSLIFLIFSRLSGLPVNYADAIFFAVKADSGQRDIVKELAKVVLSGRPQALEELTGYLNRAGQLAAQRNAAIHTAWIIKDGDDQPSPFLRINPPKVLQPDVMSQFSTLKTTLNELYMEIWRFVNREIPMPIFDAITQPTDNP